MNPTNSPLVSVCIPCYKNPELLLRSLKSILDQDYKNFEVIITDDSPGDDVFTAIENYLGDARLQYLRNSPALGSPENWNAGLRLAKGDYIKIMHHDDWFATSDALSIYVRKALETEADFICANCYNVRAGKREKHQIMHRFRTRWAQNRKLILYANYLGNPSTIFFKRPKQTVLFDKQSIWYVDVLFYYEFTKLHPRVAYIEDFLIDTSAGLDTQVTNNAISPKIGIEEFIYVANKHNLLETNNFLTKLSLIEILRRYNVRSKTEIYNMLSINIEGKIPYFLLKLPIHHQFYNVLKHLIILF